MAAWPSLLRLCYRSCLQHAALTLVLCRRLGVSVVAPPAGIKAAYRREALRLHPDVNDAPDATEAFAELSSAYGASGLLPGSHALHAQLLQCGK